jgi:LacI family transcriptional regulator
MAIRLKDIAEDLGVSMITVSKVLRNKSDVSADTRKRILKRVEELNYRPNLMARGLASGRSFTVGLVVPDITDNFFAEFARSLGASLRKHSYQLILASSDEQAEVERLEIDNLMGRGVDVLLVASCQDDLKGFQEVIDSTTPCVLIDRRIKGFPSHFIGTDDVRAGRIATEHLIGIGRKRIAHIGGLGTSPTVERLKGYKDALEAHGLSYREDMVLLSKLTENRGDQLGRKLMDTLLASPKTPDAVFCYNDLLAVGVIHSARAHRLRVPEDIAVIGCGNLTLSTYLEVPLSSVDQGTSELGERAAKLALSLVENKRSRTKVALIEPKVIARASTLGV